MKDVHFYLRFQICQHRYILLGKKWHDNFTENKKKILNACIDLFKLHNADAMTYITDGALYSLHVFQCPNVPVIQLAFMRKLSEIPSLYI